MFIYNQQYIYDLIELLDDYNVVCKQIELLNEKKNGSNNISMLDMLKSLISDVINITKLKSDEFKDVKKVS